MIKRRVMLIPAAVLALLMTSCTPSDQSNDEDGQTYQEKDNDTRNHYDKKEDCDKDNPEDKAGKNPCEEVKHDGGTGAYYLGPAYPAQYYGHSGFWEGYWIGRITSGSSGIVTRGGTYVTHTVIASNGGTIASAAGKGTIARGGFGSSAHSGFSGS